MEEREPLPAVLAATCHLARAGRLRAVLPRSGPPTNARMRRSRTIAAAADRCRGPAARIRRDCWQR